MDGSHKYSDNEYITKKEVRKNNEIVLTGFLFMLTFIFFTTAIATQIQVANYISLILLLISMIFIWYERNKLKKIIKERDN